MQRLFVKVSQEVLLPYVRNLKKASSHAAAAPARSAYMIFGVIQADGKDEPAFGDSIEGQ